MDLQKNTASNKHHEYTLSRFSKHDARIWKYFKIFIMAKTGGKQTSHGNLQTQARLFHTTLLARFQMIICRTKFL